jgi:hypothetical protein
MLEVYKGLPLMEAEGGRVAGLGEENIRLREYFNQA